MFCNSHYCVRNTSTNPYSLCVLFTVDLCPLTLSHAPGVLASTHSLPIDLDDGVAADHGQR